MKLSDHIDKEVRLSKYSHLFQDNEKSCYLNSLTLKTIVFDNCFLEPLTKLNNSSARRIIDALPNHNRSEFEKLLIELYRNAVFVPIKFNEDIFLNQIREKVLIEPDIRLLVLHITDFCNLACKYCFIEGSKKKDFKNLHMSKEIARKSICKFNETIQAKYSSEKAYSITFYGGEPLINFDIISHSLDTIKELQQEANFPKQPNIYFITNGILLNNKMIEILKEHNVFLAISIDGFKEINDKVRVYPNGKGSYDDVMKAIDLAKKNNIELGVSCVVGKHNVDYLYDICKWIVNDLDIKKVGFNHASVVKGRVEYDEIFEKKYAKNVISCQEIIQKVDGAYERRVSAMVEVFKERRAMRASCTGCGEQMTIDTKGNIGVCQGFVGDLKKFNAGSILDDKFNVCTNELFIEWSQRSPYNFKECLLCPAISICGGGCPRNADAINGDIWKLDSAFCIFVKEVLNWLVRCEIRD